VATREALVAIAHRHSSAESNGDLAGTLATLEPDPVYELYPLGRRMRGMANARHYYEHFFANVVPRITGHAMLGEWINEQGVLQEYRVSIRCDDGQVRDFRIMGLLKFGSTALAGERLYADEELLRILFKPLWGELEAVDAAPG
jgi:hypothetical protein